MADGQHPHPNLPPSKGKGIIVVKIGGSTLGNNDTSLADLVKLQQQGQDVVVVHGGGPVISQWMQRQGIAPRFVNGLRVTDAASLDIVVAVLTGLVNKELVGIMHGLGARVLGLSGIGRRNPGGPRCQPRPGLCGRGYEGQPEPINAVLAGGYIPLLAPWPCRKQPRRRPRRRTARKNAGGALNSHFLNINGDTVAGELAHALGARHLIFLTDVAGVMDGNGRVMARLNRRRPVCCSTRMW